MTIGTVKDFTRSTDEGSLVQEISVDTGGGIIATADHFSAAGDDAPPLPGDLASVEDGPGIGNKKAVGYHDPKNQGVAAGGEKRTYARAPDGSIVAEIWAKANGDVTITSLKTGGKINLNGFVIDQQGNATTPGDVTAKSGTPASVTLTTHLHPTGTGPSGPPQPGT